MLFRSNACKVGSGASLGPAFLTNFPKSMIAAGFSAVIAPLIEVDSLAARRAADCFYEAVMSDATIAEAVRRIRELATHTDVAESAKPTFLSYLAFTPTTLSLRF